MSRATQTIRLLTQGMPTPPRAYRRGYGNQLYAWPYWSYRLGLITNQEAQRINNLIYRAILDGIRRR